MSKNKVAGAQHIKKTCEETNIIKLRKHLQCDNVCSANTHYTTREKRGTSSTDDDDIMWMFLGEPKQ